MAAPIVMRNAELIYKNFAGAPDKFNKNGQMPNFSVIIPEEDVGYFRDELKLNVKKRNLNLMNISMKKCKLFLTSSGQK